MSDKPLIIVGAGGHGRVLLDVLRRAGRTVEGFVERDPSFAGKDIDGAVVLGDDDVALARDPNAIELANGVGNNARLGSSGVGPRRALFERYKAKGFSFATIISPDAVVSPAATLGEGCQIITRAIVHPGCVLGVNVIVNTGAQVDHECKIGAHCHIAPGAVLAGGVTVGENGHVGAKAVVRQGVVIGDNAVVGAGAVVVADVPPGVTVVGNPAKPLKG